MAATQAALEAGIAAVHDGARLGDVSHAIEKAAREAGCEVVREYGGHGIGREMHEPPSIRNWGPPGGGLKLERRDDLLPGADAHSGWLCDARSRRWVDGRDG